MARVLIGTGSNLGDRHAVLMAARAKVDALPETEVLAASRLYESQPAGGPPGQAVYWNGAIVVRTDRDPPGFLNDLQEIERRAGRGPSPRWSARPLDLDLLLWGEALLDTPELSVPHPRMSYRPFVLEPAAEVAGDWIHPENGWTVKALRDYQREGPRLVAVVSDRTETDRLLEQAARQAGIRLAGSTGRDRQGPVGFPEHADEVRRVLEGRTVEGTDWWLVRYPSVEGAASSSWPIPRLLVFWLRPGEVPGSHPPGPALVTATEDSAEVLQELAGAIAAMRDRPRPVDETAGIED